MFKTTTKYDEVLNKVGVSTLIVLLINWSIILKNFPMFYELLKRGCDVINIPSSIEITFFGMKLNLVFSIVPVIIAAFFRMYRMHDIISDWFGIRIRYDIDNILMPMVKTLNILGISNQTLKVNRYKLMKQVFYKYVDVEKPIIHRHLITTAFDRLVWYWMFVEGIFIITLNLCVCVVFKKKVAIIALLTWNVVSVLCCYMMKRKCMQATKKEVEEILEDNSRRQDIIGVFNGI